MSDPFWFVVLMFYICGVIVEAVDFLAALAGEEPR